MTPPPLARETRIAALRAIEAQLVAIEKIALENGRPLGEFSDRVYFLAAAALRDIRIVLDLEATQ